MPITTRSNFWILETHSTAYALGINWTGAPAHAYWRARLPYAEDYPAAPAKAGWASFSDAAHLTPEEYPGYAGMKFIEPCLKVTFADGVRDVVLTYDKADI